MKYIVVIALLVLAGFGVYYFLPQPVGDRGTVATTTVGTVDKSYVSSANRISFEYPSDYTLREDNASKGGQEIMYITLAETKAIQNAPVGGEGPPSIVIGIFSTSATSTDAWIRSEPLSNFQLAAGSTTATSVDGVSAIEYQSDGLYATRNIALMHGGRAYLFSVGWMTSVDDILRDFDALLATVSLL